MASTQTAEEVAKKMLAAIAANERGVGRALAPPRIIRIQLLMPGEVYSMRRLDGTGSLLELSPRGGVPGWVVEAVGTFIDPIGRDGGLATSIGTHGFRIWGDHGLGAYDWFPCWVRTSDVLHANEMEGQCAPPSRRNAGEVRPTWSANLGRSQVLVTTGHDVVMAETGLVIEKVVLAARAP